MNTFAKYVTAPTKPALTAFVAKMRAGKYPTILEYGALLHEAGCSQTEARDMTLRYKTALSGHSSAEDELMASLRSFSLGGS